MRNGTSLSVVTRLSFGSSASSSARSEGDRGVSTTWRTAEAAPNSRAAAVPEPLLELVVGGSDPRFAQVQIETTKFHCCDLAHSRRFPSAGLVAVTRG
jgi:hypothetical protein